MGIKKSTPRRPASVGLADALFTRTQQGVLGLLFGQPDRSFYATEIISRVAGGSGAVQRELSRLEQSGLATTHRVGNQKHYRANPAAPVFAELCNIAQKTFGLGEPVRAALAPLEHAIAAAFLYGSTAKREDSARSDIDLMVLSDSLGYADLYAVMEPVSLKLGRPINPTVYSPADWSRRLREKSSFVTRVAQQPKIWLIGSEDVVAA